MNHCVFISHIYLVFGIDSKSTSTVVQNTYMVAHDKNAKILYKIISKLFIFNHETISLTNFKGKCLEY